MLWIGNSVTVPAVGFITHHLFGIWNGDRRTASQYGKAFEVLNSRTSVIPFAAILGGRQRLPRDIKSCLKILQGIFSITLLNNYSLDSWCILCTSINAVIPLSTSVIVCLCRYCIWTTFLYSSSMLYSSHLGYLV